ncbi:MAG: hypothetical protein V3U84_12505 [Thiotrichaceae bacterium]
MRLPINKDGNIELDLFEIISEVINRATEEERQTIVEFFGFQRPIRKWMIERLADDYSRPSYCEEVHNDRLQLLQSIKVEELSFYAGLIVEKMLDERRHNKAYWELYHWCSEHKITLTAGFPHQTLKPDDWNWRQELEETVRQIVKQERPDFLEPKYAEPVT